MSVSGLAFYCCNAGIQGSKVCAKFLAGMIFREKNILLGLSGGAAGRQERSKNCFRRAGGRLAGQDIFSHGRAAQGPGNFVFRGWQPSWGFSSRESLIG